MGEKKKKKLKRKIISIFIRLLLVKSFIYAIKEEKNL